MWRRRSGRSRNPMTFCFRQTCRRRAAGQSCAASSRTSPKAGRSATRLRWRTPQWSLGSVTNTSLRRRRRRRGGEGAAKGGERDNPNKRDDYRRSYTPATDCVYYEQFEIGEIRSNNDADACQPSKHHTPRALDQCRGSQSEERDNQHGEISHHAVKRDRKSEEDGPPAGLHRLAPARCATLDRPAEAERMQPQIERDEQADEREQRDRLAMAHQ